MGTTCVRYRREGDTSLGTVSAVFPLESRRSSFTLVLPSTPDVCVSFFSELFERTFERETWLLGLFKAFILKVTVGE